MLSVLCFVIDLCRCCEEWSNSTSCSGSNPLLLRSVLSSCCPYWTHYNIILLMLTQDVGRWQNSTTWRFQIDFSFSVLGVFAFEVAWLELNLVKTAVRLSWWKYFVITSSWTPSCSNSSLSAAYVFPAAVRHIFMRQISLRCQRATDEISQCVTCIHTVRFCRKLNNSIQPQRDSMDFFPSACQMTCGITWLCLPGYYEKMIQDLGHQTQSH